MTLEPPPAASPDRPRRIPIRVASPAPATTRGLSPAWLLAAPHRLFFALGMLGLAAVSLWWLVQMLARAFGVPLPLAVPPSWVHGWTMANGFLPFFMFGFLFTAGPKWQHVEGPPARPLLPSGLLAFGGLLFALAGAHVDAWMTAIGALMVAAGWAALLWRFGALCRASRFPDRVHARLILIFFVCGWLAHPVFAAGVARTSAVAVHSAEMLSFWLFIAPVYVTVAHRLIPFFTTGVIPQLDAWRPLWLLVAFNGIVLAHGLLSVLGLAQPGTLVSALRVALDATGAALLFFVAWRWGLVQSLRNRLLAMLHLGFLWLGIAFALYAWSEALLIAGLPQAGLGLAPLHALTMGFFGSVAFAMVTRVTAGHGGRQLVAETLTWALFWLLQAAVMVRLLVDVWPAPGWWLTPLAIALWCAAVLPWAVRNLRIYLAPRADGRPG
ncbi:MAG: NnrS family protein [Burkholderiaceae bacterium]|jgi:uncharacterized protein involved in response to NO|nr:NnrS family protein [Burkholderiaceae bacterium]